MSNQTILYVEDEEADVLMLQFAFKQLQIASPLKVVKNGEQALAYLSGTGQYSDRTQHPLPGLILLDLNIPRIPGLKVLQWIREQLQFAELPVVIYTSSDGPEEMEKARRLGANDYVVKPLGMDELSAAVRKLTDRWLQ